MSSSIYSGVSGLKSQQTKLDVIGNNIANISTAGYKSQRVTFSDMLSQKLSGAVGPSTTSDRGGINPRQIGLGVSVGSVDTNMTTGSSQTTGNSMDVAIGGDGFFIVKGGTSSEYEFTRAGNFGVDRSGNLTVNGMKVCGWQQYTTDNNGNYTYNTQTAAQPINVFTDSANGNKQVIAPKATTTEIISGNLDPTKTAKGSALNNIGTPPAAADSLVTMTAYDSQGNHYDVQVKMSKCYTDAATGNTSWYWEVPSSSQLTVGAPSSGYVEFDNHGKLITSDANFNTAPNLTLKPSSGSGSFTVKMDMSNLSTYTSSSGNVVKASYDGYAGGELNGLSIGSDGVIIGNYTNNQKQPLGMIALATFANPAGLEKVGNNLYTTTTNSGNFTGGVAPGASGTGKLSAGTLEGSNVDLAEQFSDMMITERAYQANSKVITTSDTMMETLINMKR